MNCLRLATPFRDTISTRAIVYSLVRTCVRMHARVRERRRNARNHSWHVHLWNLGKKFNSYEPKDTVNTKLYHSRERHSLWRGFLKHFTQTASSLDPVTRFWEIFSRNQREYVFFFFFFFCFGACIKMQENFHLRNYCMNIYRRRLLLTRDIWNYV